jgi:hypothetical protein
MNLVQLLPYYIHDTVAPWAKPHAVRVIVRENLRGDGTRRCSLRGKGNKAAKREARIANDLAYRDTPFLPLLPAEVDRLAEQWSESRTFPPRRALVHP